MLEASPPLLTVELADADLTEGWAGHLAQQAVTPLAIHLEGDLGAGKTTFSRGFLRGLGFEGSVKSPTYTLVEPYEIGSVAVYHCDLYRLADPSELTYLGFTDYLSEQAIFLVEWPSRGAWMLPAPDVTLHLEVAAVGRRLRLWAHSATGFAVLNALA